MNKQQKELIAKAKSAALEALLHNDHGSYRNLPRTAGWGYPEPYTRDLMICSLGILTTGNERLLKSLRRVLETLAKNQSELGHIPSLVHDPEDRGSSDATPLFLMATGLYRRVTGEKDFIEEAVQKAFKWLEYQSPPNRCLVAQLPTSDWRDEQWVLGYGLYVNTIVYTDLCLFGQHERAAEAKEAMERFTVRGERQQRHVHEGLVLRRKPYYAMWSYKVYRGERFDLLGNSLAILSGIASPSRARKLISWIEKESEGLRANGELVVDLPPNLFPYIRPGEPDWMPRYKKYNQPGEYHNGGIWPFVCGFYVAALVAANKYKLAERELLALTELVRAARKADVEFGFNEWYRAQDGRPRGEDWQSWSAAMYLYAAKCVEEKRTPFFEEIRQSDGQAD
ncbi:MAG: glycoside hydrolase 100 family protein [Sedimentisphaerales bacterium]